MSFDLKETVTESIVSQLESGIIPWNKPWTSGDADGAKSHVTGRPYSFINQLLLNRAGEYLTFNQCKAEGGRVKKGAKSKLIVFWKVYKKQVKDADGSDVLNDDGSFKTENYPILRYLQVFHVDDCEGIAPRWSADAAIPIDPIADAETLFNEYPAREGIAFKQTDPTSAYYSPLQDLINVPEISHFDSAEEYYSTLFHEATHSTGSVKRLARIDARSEFGSENYSKEELVAELGAAYICRRLGIDNSRTVKNSAAYIQSWLSALKNDKRLIASAAARAEKAVKFIFNESTAAADSDAA